MKKIFFLILAILILGSFFVLPFILKVKVQCKSQFGECPDQIVSSLHQADSKSLQLAKNQIGKVLKQNYLLTDYSTQFKLPDILVVNVLIRKPDFALYNKNTSELWLVDGDGTILIKTNDTTLPKIVTESDIPKSGQKVDAQTLNALKIIEGVWEMYQVGMGELGGAALVVDLPGKINVIFPLDMDPQVSLGALRLIYTKITTGDSAGKFSQIDLRFKNPVLR